MTEITLQEKAALIRKAADWLEKNQQSLESTGVYLSPSVYTRKDYVEVRIGVAIYPEQAIALRQLFAGKQASVAEDDYHKDLQIFDEEAGLYIGWNEPPTRKPVQKDRTLVTFTLGEEVGL